MSLPPFRRALDNELWIKHVFCPDEDLFVAKIFEMITPSAIKAKINQLKNSRQLPVLDKHSRQRDPGKSPLALARIFVWAAQVLAVPCPELYVRSDVPGALVAVHAAPPALLAGNTLLNGFSDQELAFIVGKHLSFCRGEHYIKCWFPSLAELNILFFGGVRIVAPNVEVPREIADQVGATAAELAKHVQPVYKEALRIIVGKLAQEQRSVDVAKWSRCVELTASRTGFLLCGDLEVAKKMIAAEPETPDDVSREQKKEEVIRFSASPAYSTLGEALGAPSG
jgi:hypothetical protein